MAQTVNVELLHGLQVHDISVPCFLTFGQLKETARALTGVPIEHIKLNFKGREKPDSDTLAWAGVKHGSKIFVGESDAYKAHIARQREPAPPAAPPQPQPQAQAEAPAAQPGWEQFPAVPSAASPLPQPQGPSSPLQAPQGMSPLQGVGGPFPTGARAPPPTPVARPRPTAMTEAERSLDAIGRVASQVDELQSRMQGLPGAGNARLEAARLVEALTQRLLALDGIEVTPETRQARKDQINRINALCDQLELLKTGE